MDLTSKKGNHEVTWLQAHLLGTGDRYDHKNPYKSAKQAKIKSEIFQ